MKQFWDAVKLAEFFGLKPWADALLAKGCHVVGRPNKCVVIHGGEVLAECPIGQYQAGSYAKGDSHPSLSPVQARGLMEAMLEKAGERLKAKAMMTAIVAEQPTITAHLKAVKKLGIKEVLGDGFYQVEGDVEEGPPVVGSPVPPNHPNVNVKVMTEPEPAATQPTLAQAFAPLAAKMMAKAGEQLEKEKPMGALASVPCSAKEMDELPIVQLASASRLYQPTAGTDSTSRYFAVGLSPKLNLAARWKGGSGSMSLRVEGPGLGTAGVREMLKAVGFSKVSEQYASMHVAVADEVDAAKVLGSVLVAIPAPWEGPVPSAQRLAGKGA